VDKRRCVVKQRSALLYSPAGMNCGGVSPFLGVDVIPLLGPYMDESANWALFDGFFPSASVDISSQRRHR
jgi:hypothetical protein